MSLSYPFPEAFHEAVRPGLEGLAADPRLRLRAAQDETFRRRAERACVGSDYFSRLLIRHPEWLAELDASGELDRPPSPATVARRFAIATPSNEEAALATLRRTRHRELLRVMWRDLNDLAPVREILEELSAIADGAIQAAADWCRHELETRHGTPRSADGSPVEFVVLAMGKLGGYELNFSSDIDLVFLYRDAGQTDGERPLDHERFFLRLGQRVARLLDHPTADGFVYRVDMRLRPFGGSGPLAISFASFETYLQRHGRDWERYAYVKARAVTGREAAAPLANDVLRPFVYRRYLDFGVFESLRDMKTLIEQEVVRRDLTDNIKLGRGGIREIEFITQSFQLIRGGSDPDLRNPSLLTVLPRLSSPRALGEQATRELLAAYHFLRRLENRLQMLDDRQVHVLPADALARARVAWTMDFASWDELRAELETHRDHVHTHFRHTAFAAQGSGGEDRELQAIAHAWHTADSGQAADVLREQGLPDKHAEAIAQRMAGLRGSALLQRMDAPSRKRLDEVMPPLLKTLIGLENPSQTFERLQPILEAVARRSAYLALLRENPHALRRLLDFVQRSGFLAAQLATWPLLLDELLEEELLQTPPSREQLAADLAARLQAAPSDDLEARLNALRAFQRVGMFRVAVADIVGGLPLMRVSDRLTDIAELSLELALGMAWDELTERHGQPVEPDAHGGTRTAGFAIVAYGKLGGLELGYRSDLDLVFVHDADRLDGHTDGAKPLPTAVFFARLTQRVIHFLSIQTTSGRLYEVDTRLRPSGASGLPVASLKSFERYQHEQAWTWEHQALLRARAVAGHAATREAFEALRVRVLIDAVRRDTLRGDVAAMRERMRDELSAGSAGKFDIKQGAGGLADIEFLVQYLVLAHAAQHPPLTRWSDNIRQLETLAQAGVITADEAERTAEIYRSYRSRMHALSLADLPEIVGDEEFRAEREWVRQRWQAAFGAAARS